MRVVLQIIAAVLLVFWLMSVLVFAVGQLFHVLLLLAALSFFLSRRKRKKKEHGLPEKN
jgi:hypothetical protein